MNTGKRIGGYTVQYGNPVSIIAQAVVVGKKEGEGPLKDTFDYIYDDNTMGRDTWEKAESKLQEDTLDRLLGKTKLKTDDIEFIFAGDLLNQCVASAYALRGYNIPMFGLYGACSTFAEGVTLAAMSVDGGFANHAAVVVSSHFCSAERQYRYPLDYGAVRTPTAQWTVTGSGGLILSASCGHPAVTRSTTGRMVDLGITDASNMGAAMAPAAISTFTAFFQDTNTKPSDYDHIFSGDLGKLGKAIVIDLMAKDGYNMSENYDDCGCLIFDEKQDVVCGGSGCGCLASVFSGKIMSELREKKLNNVLILGTGALMNPMMVTQGETIVGIGHLVQIENK